MPVMTVRGSWAYVVRPVTKAMWLLVASVAVACSSPSPVVPATASPTSPPSPTAIASPSSQPSVETSSVASSNLNSLTVDGPFRLELIMPRTVWHTADPISGRAILSYSGQEPTLIAASSQAVITFVYDEIGGDQETTYPISADCHTYQLDPATPIGEPVRMSTQPDGVNAHLSAGDWKITAVAQFAGGPGAVPSPFDLLDLCRSTQYEIRASMTVTVLQ